MVKEIPIESLVAQVVTQVIERLRHENIAVTGPNDTGQAEKTSEETGMSGRNRDSSARVAGVRSSPRKQPSEAAGTPVDSMNAARPPLIRPPGLSVTTIPSAQASSKK